VQLGALVLKDADGLNSDQDWSEVLSGGEKQRIAMARLFYHKPEFAILDECTSTISVEVEHMLYTKAKDMGITVFTISHRASLFKFHDWYLKFEGDGIYSFSKLNENTGTQDARNALLKFKNAKENKIIESVKAVQNESMDKSQVESETQENIVTDKPLKKSNFVENTTETTNYIQADSNNQDEEDTPESETMKQKKLD
jgi:ABC-type transport system involved in cytochrome bd biosynthesis fused ATPase/permease subunit